MTNLLSRGMVFLVTCVCALLCACAGGEEADDASAAPSVGEAAGAETEQAANITDQFQALRYLEGDWRGSGYEGGPFFESYRFINDSTIEMTAWTDSTLTAARERSQYLLRGGVVRTSSGARLMRVDEEGHHFQAASYGWTFRREGPDRWTARVSSTTTYTMDRVVRP